MQVRKQWSKVLKIREVKQHARCDDCAKLDKLRANARAKGNQAELDRVNLAKQHHLSCMWKDRAWEARVVQLSEESCAAGCTLPRQQRVLAIAIDGMDQAKFKAVTLNYKLKVVFMLWAV